MRTAGLLCLSLVLLGCGGTKTAKLTNVKTNEVSEIKFSYNGSDNGTLQGTIGSESFKGKYTRTPSGTSQWGRIYESVYPTGGTFNFGGNDDTTQVDSEQQGTAVAISANGDELRCEYATTALKTGGIGACRDNHGNEYRVQF